MKNNIEYYNRLKTLNKEILILVDKENRKEVDKRLGEMYRIFSAIQREYTEELSRVLMEVDI